MRALAFAAAAAAFLYMGEAGAVENRLNVMLELSPLFTVDQPVRSITSQGFVEGGFHARAALEYQFMERIGAEAGYTVDLLFHNVSAGVAAQQVIFAGARFRPWYSLVQNYLLPRPPPAKSQPITIHDILSDAFVDAHVGVALSDSTRFAYDIGIGARVPIYSPVQVGLFLRWQQLLGGDGDPSFKQIMFGVFGTLGFLPVHPEPDSDGDGVPDSQDKCPNTPKGANVNHYGCEIVESTTPPPACSDTDLDGVCDGEDECPDTPQGTQVDKKGCPLNAPPPEPPATP